MRFNLIRTIFGRFRAWQILTGLALVGLGVAIGLQSLAQAADEPGELGQITGRGNVIFGVSDWQLFGKSISTTRFTSKLALADLKEAAGPVSPSRLRIPALAIDALIEDVDLRNGAMDVPSNIWNAGWLKSGPLPGQVGNAVIDGHKDSVKGVAIFWDLPKLKSGDRLYVSDSDGNELTFEVTEVASYANSDFPVEKVFGAVNEKHLNLISCDGTFIYSQHNYDKRVVVYTKLVENENN